MSVGGKGVAPLVEQAEARQSHQIPMLMQSHEMIQDLSEYAEEVRQL